jgi:D-arabinose 1-dehydrogenase-like Zn-dependent alcohol dehydrogenase
MDPYLGLLKIDATMVLVGAVEPLKPFHGNIIMGRKRIGSLIGGIKETQEMLDFCGEIILLVILNLSICKILTKLMGVLQVMM